MPNVLDLSQVANNTMKLTGAHEETLKDILCSDIKNEEYQEIKEIKTFYIKEGRNLFDIFNEAASSFTDMGVLPLKIKLLLLITDEREGDNYPTFINKLFMNDKELELILMENKNNITDGVTILPHWYKNERSFIVINNGTSFTQRPLVESFSFTFKKEKVKIILPVRKRA